MIADYNNTKGGVNDIDKCTRRWPLAIFYRIVDICGANSVIIFQSSRTMITAQKERKLARQMILPHLQRRQHNQKLPRLLRDTISNILGPDSVPPPPVVSAM